MRGRERHDCQESRNVDARLSFRTCDKRPTQSLPMELRTHAKPINLKCMRCLPLERDEALYAATVFRHEHRERFDIALVRRIRLRHAEPGRQGRENFGADRALVGEQFLNRES